MANYTDVFPQSNLNDSSKPWSRKLEEVTRETSYGLENLKVAINGDNRAASGQLAVLGRLIDAVSAQITELGSRNSGNVSTGNVSVNANSTNFVTATRVMTVPGETYGRNNIVTFNAGYTFSASSQVTCFVKITKGSEIFYTGTFTNGVTVPSGWQQQLSGTFVLPVSTSGESLTLTLQVSNFQSANPNTVTLVSPTLSYVRADRVY